MDGSDRAESASTDPTAGTVPTVTKEQIESIERERRRQAECDRRLTLESASESLLRRTLRGCFSPVRSASNVNGTSGSER
jgi:hypothetical protein